MSASAVKVPASPGVLELRAGLTSLLPELRLRALKLCRARDAADDLVQETAARALSFEKSYEANTNLKAWLQQIMFSLFITQCRKRKRSYRFLAEHGADPNLWCGSAEPTRPSEALSPPVKHAIKALPAQFGRVVVLVDLHDLSYAEAAAQLGVPIGTVMSRLHRGRRLLKGRLVPDAERSAA